MEKIYKVKVRSLRPLLVNCFNVEEHIKKQKKQTGISHDPQLEAEKSLYKDNDGWIYQPADHIEGALIKTGPKFRIPGAGKKTYKDRLKSEVFVSPQKIPITLDGKDIGDTWKIDTRAAVIGGKSRVVVSRPVWDKWELEFNIQILDNELIPGDTLKDILIEAGRSQGIGTFRPKFGLFEVIEFEEVNDK